MGHFFSRKILFFSGALGLGLTCLGLEPALNLRDVSLSSLDLAQVIITKEEWSK